MPAAAAARSARAWALSDAARAPLTAEEPGREDSESTLSTSALLGVEAASSGWLPQDASRKAAVVIVITSIVKRRNMMSLQLAEFVKEYRGRVWLAIPGLRLLPVGLSGAIYSETGQVNILGRLSQELICILYVRALAWRLISFWVRKRLILRPVDGRFFALQTPDNPASSASLFSHFSINLSMPSMAERGGAAAARRRRMVNASYSSSLKNNSSRRVPLALRSMAG